MKTYILTLLLCLFATGLNAQTTAKDTVSLQEIFDPSFNLNADERAIDLVNEINSNMYGLRKSIFTIGTPVILIAIVLLMLFLIFFLPGIFLYNLFYMLKTRRDKETILQFHRLATDYLISREQNPPLPLLPGMNKQRNQQLLIEYTGQAIRLFRGKVEERLIRLYQTNVKPSNIQRIVSRMNNYEKALLCRKGITVPPRPEVIRIAHSYIQSKNDDLRLWSRMLYLRGVPTDFVASFKGYPFHLTHWEQIVYCELLVRMKEQAPSLEPLLEESNPTVVEFARRMIQRSKQTS